MKADDGHFEYRRILLFILLFKSRWTLCNITKIWCVLRSANIPWTSEM